MRSLTGVQHLHSDVQPMTAAERVLAAIHPADWPRPRNSAPIARPRRSPGVEVLGFAK